MAANIANSARPAAIKSSPRRCSRITRSCARPKQRRRRQTTRARRARAPTSPPNREDLRPHEPARQVSCCPMPCEPAESPMFSRTLFTALPGLVLALAPLPAAAHCFVGARFLPATLAIDDPCVADELSLPTVARFNTGDDPSARQLDISAEYSKRITRSEEHTSEFQSDSL